MPAMWVLMRKAALSNRRAADPLPFTGDFALPQRGLRGDHAE